jgi:hypothetical protein
MNRNGTPGNLTPYPPGVSGNPSGRPKRRPITDEYFQILSEPIPETLRLKVNAQFKEELLPKGTTWARAGALRRALDSLMEGGHMASKEMREAIEGKAPLRLEIQGVQRQETTLRVIFEKRTTTSQLSSESNTE